MFSPSNRSPHLAEEEEEETQLLCQTNPTKEATNITWNCTVGTNDNIMASMFMMGSTRMRMSVAFNGTLLSQSTLPLILLSTMSSFFSKLHFPHSKKSGAWEGTYPGE